MAEQLTMNRRAFLVSTAAMAGGFALTVAVPKQAGAMPVIGQEFPGDASEGAELSAWIAISPDDTVTVRVPTPDIGNGVMTQIPYTVAEELRCDLSKLNPEFASPTRDYLEEGVYTASGGSLAFFSGRSTSAVRTQVLLQAGASARERLKAAAAAEWGIEPNQVEAENSILTNTATGDTLRYGEVAEQAAGIVLDQEPALKPQSEWTVLGNLPPGKMQNPAVVTGEAIYGIDVILPDMLYAAILQSPVQGGRLKSYDANAVKDMPGVHSVVVIDPDEPRADLPIDPPMGFLPPAQAAVAVVADHYWQAKSALEALPVEWEDGDGARWTDSEMMRSAAFEALDGAELTTNAELGDLTALDAADKVFEAEYWTPYTDNAPLEPLNGTALVTENSVELWHPTQHPQQSWAVSAHETGVPLENVHVHQTFVGGAFGRRIYGDDVRLVIAVAKQVPGRPVHVIWTREEMLRQGRYRPAVAARFRAGLGSDGLPVAVHGRAAGAGMYLSGFDDGPLATGLVPNALFETVEMPFHLMSGPNRGPGYNSFAFMVESFIDELSYEAGVDPLEYRLKLYANYRDPGWVQVLQTLKAKSGWGKELPRGQGMGVAISNWDMSEDFFGTTLGTVAHVEVSPEGKLTVHQLDVAFDCGRIMNEDAVRAEVEGGTIWGYNLAMNEELTVQNGRIVEGNFDTYPMFRMKDIPPINVHFEGLSGHDRFSEIGEPPVGPVSAAISNAVFAATGKRIRSMPFRKEDLSWS